MRPLIGVTSYYIGKGEDSERSRGFGRDISVSSMDYLRSLRRVDSTPVPLPVMNDEKYISDIANKFDGFLFSGGADIDPKNYGETLKIFDDPTVSDSIKLVPERDEFELKLLKKAIEKNKPVLGICRGIQLINVYYDGTLKQDLRDSKNVKYNHMPSSSPKWNPIHEVRFEKNSEVRNAYNEERIQVNSFHHQIIDDVGKGLKVTARASDSTIEAIEDPNEKFVVGVQWHPEMMTEKYSKQLKIFQRFVNAIDLD